MKYLIFGGAFDPIHKGHLHKISEALNILKYNKALIMPTYKNMFGKEMTPGWMRCLMVQKALNDFGDNRLELSDFEVINRIKASTFEVIHRLLKETGIDKHYNAYVIGSDQAKLINKWNRWEELLDLIPFVVMVRSIDDEIPSLFFKKPHKVLINRACPVSSTEIRDIIKQGDKPYDLLTTNTLKYIEENDLYV
jgi:nicotinate-nucleotide adenylyltransferase